MTGLQKIIEQINGDAAQKAQEIENEAHKKAEVILAEAKEKEIKNSSKLKKDELIQELSENDLSGQACDETIESNAHTEEYIETDVTSGNIAEPSNGSYKLTNADDEIVEFMIRIHFHDMPQNRLAADFNHRFRLELGFLAQPGSESPR